MNRDDVIRLAQEAGFVLAQNATEEAIERFMRFASMAVADAMARGLSAPIVVKTADIDPKLLRDMLTKAPAAQLVLMPEPTPEAIEEAVAAERRKHQAQIELWKGEAIKAEMWRGLALSKDPMAAGRVVQQIQHEAAVVEREAIAAEFDRRAETGTGFYEPDEPAAIVRARGTA